MACNHKTDDGTTVAEGLCPKCLTLVGYTLEQKIDWMIQMMLRNGLL